MTNKPDDISKIAREIMSGGMNSEHVSALAKLTAKQIYSQGYQAGEAASKKDMHDYIWNEAIDHAAMWAGSRPIKEVTDLKDHEKALLVQAAFVYVANEIRKLRK